MVIHDIKLYDAKTDTVTIVTSLPERRQDYDRARGRMTIEKWARSLRHNNPSLFLTVVFKFRIWYN